MTPKEKSKELVDKYDETLPYLKSKSKAKQCALIAVDLVVNQWEIIDVYLADGNGELNENLRYWYEVKQEIEKL